MKTWITVSSAGSSGRIGEVVIHAGMTTPAARRLEAGEDPMAAAPIAGAAIGLRTRCAAQAIELTRIHGSGITAVMALDLVSVDFPSGEFTAVIGPAGSGKSTLLHCLAGLDRPDSGTVLIGDVDITKLKEAELTKLRRDRIGFIFQSFNLLPQLTAEENLELPLRLSGRSPDRAWIDGIVDAFDLRPHLAQRPAELTGWQQQRVATARALAGHPEIILADEPTGNLDGRSGAELLALFQRSVHELAQTIVMVTQDANAAAHADRVVFLANGRVVDEMSHPTGQMIHDRARSIRV
jgi:putative ABC transport system ATP-binding protein